MVGGNHLYSTFVRCFHHFFHIYIPGKCFYIHKVHISAFRNFFIQHYILIWFYRALATFLRSAKCKKNRCLSKNISQLLRSIFHTFIIVHFLEPVHTPLHYICSYLTDMLRLIQNLIYCLTNNRYTDFRNTLTDCNISYYYRFHNFDLPPNSFVIYLIFSISQNILDFCLFFCYTPYLYENFI